MAQAVEPYVCEVLLVGKNEGQVPPEAKTHGRFVADAPGFPGPLAGLASALAHAAKPWVFLTGADMPFWSEETLKEFWNLRESPVLSDAVVPYADDRWQPLCALWNNRCLQALEAFPWKSFQHFLNEGGLKVRKVEETTLRSFDPELLCLRSFNTPGEWEKIKQREPKSYTE